MLALPAPRQSSRKARVLNRAIAKMAGSDEQRERGAPKGSDFSPKPSGRVAGKKDAALAAALRANLARRKARERALRESTLKDDGADKKSDGEG